MQSFPPPIVHTDPAEEVEYVWTQRQIIWFATVLFALGSVAGVLLAVILAALVR
jgi:hypothetical protein